VGDLFSDYGPHPPRRVYDRDGYLRTAFDMQAARRSAIGPQPEGGHLAMRGEFACSIYEAHIVGLVRSRYQMQAEVMLNRRLVTGRA